MPTISLVDLLVELRGLGVKGTPTTDNGLLLAPMSVLPKALSGAVMVHKPQILRLMAAAGRAQVVSHPAARARGEEWKK